MVLIVLFLLFRVLGVLMIILLNWLLFIFLAVREKLVLLSFVFLIVIMVLFGREVKLMVCFEFRYLLLMI